jgi:hypothetical protein
MTSLSVGVSFYFDLIIGCPIAEPENILTASWSIRVSIIRRGHLAAIGLSMLPAYLLQTFGA